MASSQNIFLPEGIVADILKKLPVKPLLRFKCVSKQWLSLISSPTFVKTHFRSQSQRIMIILRDPTHRLMHCSTHSLISEQITEATNNDFPQDWISFFGSCNGLLLIFRGDFQDFDLFLCNPTLGLYQELPPTHIIEKEDVDWAAFGLGYNESKDDYVVLSVLISDIGGFKSHVKLYSSRTNSWKRIGDVTFGHPENDTVCKFVDGKFHLHACPVDGCSFRDPGPPTLYDIVSFDVEEEAYGVIGQPNYGAGVVALSLGELGGRLCVLSSKEIHADLWVMSEYGVVESWTKKVTIPYVNYSIRSLYLKPLVMLQSRKILLVQKLDYVEHQVLHKHHFVVYDPNDNSMRVPETVNFGNFEEADVYVESLVWPTMDLDE